MSNSSSAAFKIGDKVVYPMHGAGVIEAIEEREILGETRNYYVINIPTGDMQVLVPMDNVDNIGLREIIGATEAEMVLDKMRNYELEEGVNWNKRYRVNLDKIKTGDIYEVADVVRSLMLREDDKGLSAGERKMLESARQMLISELALASNLEEDAVFTLLADMVKEQDQI